MIGRRMFLKAAAVLGPAARKAAEGEALKLMQPGRLDEAPLAVATKVIGRRYRGRTDEEEIKTRQGMIAYMKLWGRIPHHVDEELRERAKSVYHLDVDIATKVSWSLSFKILTQQQRNYELSLQRTKHRPFAEAAREEFEKLLGFEWD